MRYNLVTGTIAAVRSSIDSIGFRWSVILDGTMMRARPDSFAMAGIGLFCLSLSIAVAVAISGLGRGIAADNQAVVVERASSQVSRDYIHVNGIPFVRKKPDFGGEACVAMVLQAMRHDADQDYVHDQAGLDPLLARGCFTAELVKAVKRIGFQPGPVWYRCSKADFDTTWKQMQTELGNSVVSIFCLRENEQEKFVLVTGIETDQNTIVFHDPGRANGKDRRLSRADFYRSCDLGQQQFVRLVLDLKAKVEVQSKKGFTDADYAQHVMKLRKKLPDASFSIVVQKPFVVIGDEGERIVKQRSLHTIKWAVDLLKQDYFTKDPNAIIDVWLFKNKASYEKNCQALFNMRPGTPFGFYSSIHRALVMNISTGGGTLVHEIVHPFIESNFPSCPSWFNEGLASLYEQSGSRNGKIIGKTNWRLRGLQLAIESDRLGDFSTLCNTSRREFYDDGQGTNYAQARYLCYYLQERGLLRKYYHQFRKNSGSDPAGYETLKSVLGTQDMARFQQDWERYVLKLRF